MWKWFKGIHDTGFKGTDRAGNRKNGSIVFYDTSLTEVGRFNFFNGWPHQDRHRCGQHRLERPGEGEHHAGHRTARAGQVSLQTSYPFVLPRGYVDAAGTVHKEGRMRLATARDELEPLRDPTVTGPDDPRLTVLVLARVVEKLGTVELVTHPRDRGPVRDRPCVPAGLLRRHQLRQPGGVRAAAACSGRGTAVAGSGTAGSGRPGRGSGAGAGQVAREPEPDYPTAAAFESFGDRDGSAAFDGFAASLEQPVSRRGSIEEIPRGR